MLYLPSLVCGSLVLHTLLLMQINMIIIVRIKKDAAPAATNPYDKFLFPVMVKCNSAMYNYYFNTIHKKFLYIRAMSNINATLGHTYVFVYNAFSKYCNGTRSVNKIPFCFLCFQNAISFSISKI